MISVTRKRDLLRWFVELVILFFSFSVSYLTFGFFLPLILVIEYQEYQLWKIKMQITIINQNIDKLSEATKTGIRTKTREDF